MKTPTKLTLAIALLATGLVSSASASSHGETTYYDTIRPHGHPRSDAIYNANLNACYKSSGESRTAVYDTPAFKQCMLTRGYRFEFTKVVQDAPTTTARAAAPWYYSGPSISISIGSGDDSATASDDNSAAQQNDADEQAGFAAANAAYAQDDATAAANVAAAASFDAQMTVGN